MRYCILIAYGKDNVDKATIQLTLANAALDRADDVTVIFMSEGVHMAMAGYADDMDNGAPFKPVRELIAGLRQKGASIAACVPCIKNRGLAEEDVMDDVRLIGGPEVLDLLAGSDRSIQL
jgi:tRNA 2-thiouridine synthesizing protein D